LFPATDTPPTTEVGDSVRAEIATGVPEVTVRFAVLVTPL
jgi:hypothetical protein